MAKISFGNEITLAQASQLLIHAGHTNRFLLEGEPGIGKSTLMNPLKDHFGDAYSYSYIDCSTLDLGDIGYPAMDHEEQVARFYPNVRFGFSNRNRDRPVVIMLDEFGKAMQPVQNMLHPLLEVSNPRLGDVALPQGSIVFLTSNLSSDGVGDNIKAHTINRVTKVKVKKPDADAWIPWAVTNKIDPVVLAWVKQFPHCLASYTEASQEKNPYIFNPQRPQLSYVTPRSLELLSKIVSKRQNFDTEALLSAASGTVGEAAARDIHAFIEYADQIPSWEEIFRNPTKTKVPEIPGAIAVLVFGAITKVSKTTYPALAKYLERLALEWQAVFYANISYDHNQVEQISNTKEFQDWFATNFDVI